MLVTACGQDSAAPAKKPEQKVEKKAEETAQKAEDAAKKAENTAKKPTQGIPLPDNF